MKRISLLVALCVGSGLLGWIGAVWSQPLNDAICQQQPENCTNLGWAWGYGWDGEAWFVTRCYALSGGYRQCVYDPQQNCSISLFSLACWGENDDEVVCYFNMPSCGAVP